ncbi:MAG: hypothetical protein IRZ03_13615 [Acidobacterium ailaaui]|nr:hypothetical protein [Pseudacidobacterium ailaaui]
MSFLTGVAAKVLFWIAIVLAVGASYWFAYHKGYASASAECDAKMQALRADMLQKLAQAQKDYEQKASAAENYYQDRLSKIKPKVVTITKEVDRYVANAPGAASCIADPEFMRIWRDANSGSAASADAAR